MGNSSELQINPGDPAGGRRREESREKRRRILEAASTCFGEKGFGGATIEAIAADAGVSNGLLYQFFKSKQHLFEVVLDEVIRDWQRAIAAETGPDSANTPGEKLEAMFRCSVEFCRDHPLLPALLTRDRVLQLERRAPDRVDRLDAHRELAASILRDGIASGEFRSNLDVAAVADVVCQLHVDYSTRAYVRDPHFPADPALIDAVVDLIRQAVTAQGT